MNAVVLQGHLKVNLEFKKPNQTKENKNKTKKTLDPMNADTDSVTFHN